ncbi:uncharacterized protein HNQ56_003822 [Anaerotaenia torta]|uniref:TPM domain-containing protein n=1 Tax=Anaerotaenia torta TaxID=433293 RepID=UPI003D239DA6
MKGLYKILFILLLVLIVPYKTAAADTLDPADGFYVNDFADVINADTEEKILEFGKQLEDQTSAQLVLVTVDFTDGESLENYALDMFNKWGIGSKEKNNGVLILLSIGDDDYWAMQGEGLEDTLTSGKMSGILQEYLEPDFAAKDYSAGAEKVYHAFYQALGGQWKNASEETDKILSDKTGPYTFDYADMIDNKTRDHINRYSSETKELCEAGFYIVTKDHCEAGLSFQEDAINTFEEFNVGSRDVLLVFYKNDDNYWLLPGEEAEKFANEDVLKDILDNALEPKFAAGDYSRGASFVADRFYVLFKKNFGEVRKGTSTNSSHAFEGADNRAEGSSQGGVVAFFFVILLIVIFSSGRRRRRYRNTYGMPYNPYGGRHIGWHHPGGYRGHHGYHGRSMGTGFNSGRSSWSNDNKSGSGAGRSTSGGGSWGSSGGAGRSSSSSSSFTGGSGGASRGGGAGRSSGGFGGGSSARSSGAGRSTSGGGGSSRGGGAGRSK